MDLKQVSLELRNERIVGARALYDDGQTEALVIKEQNLEGRLTFQNSKGNNVTVLINTGLFTWNGHIWFVKDKSDLAKLKATEILQGSNPAA